MTLWDSLCCIGYGIRARYTAIQHWRRGHNLRWRANMEIWVGCTGDIVCKDCPDNKGVGVILWCRYNRVLNKITQAVCGMLGHAERKHPQRYSGCDANDSPVMEYIIDEWYCFRCGESL